MVAKDKTFIQHKLPKITSIFSAKNYVIYEEVKVSYTLDSNEILIISDSFTT